MAGKKQQSPSYTKRSRISLTNRKSMNILMVLGVLVIFSFSFSQTAFKIIHLRSQHPNRKEIVLWENLMSEKEKEVRRILAKLDHQMPGISFSQITTTTNPWRSRAILLHQKDHYCIGEQLMVLVYMFDYSGNRKAYGGDFFRVRIHSPELQAGASGHITDYRNGTYLVNFTLFWQGTVHVSLLLIHPSEVVSSLWTARKKGYEKITFTGKFHHGTSEISAECGFVMSTTKELCKYMDERDEEAFYCIKPPDIPCEAFVWMKSENSPISYLTTSEKQLLDSYVGIEIPKLFGKIRVSNCKRNKRNVQKCKLRVGSSHPTGFVWKNQWYPRFCTIPTFMNLDQINTCLKRKMFLFLGDSTLRQWFEYFLNFLKSLKLLDTHGTGKLQNMLAVDLDRNFLIQWKKHGFPLVTRIDHLMTDHKYAAREIDGVAGDKDTAIVFCLGQHFRPFPIELFIRRMINIREAIQRLLLRSPETKVIIKSENIRELNTDIERFGDFHGYTQFLAVKDIFQGLNVVFIDAWDMTIAYGTTDVHPPHHVVENQINLFLDSIC